jgi:hypothetical protein
MLNQLDVQLNVPLSFFPLFFGQATPPAHFIFFILGFSGERPQLVRTCASVGSWALVAFPTQIELRASLTVITSARKNFSEARGTLLNKFRRIAVVQMPKNH